MITKKLTMKFKTGKGKSVTISLDNPKENITEQEIKDAMDLIVEKNVFFIDGSDIVSTVEAKITTTDETVHDLIV